MTVPNDINAVLGDLAITLGAPVAVDVTIGAQTVTGLLRRNDEPIMEGVDTRAMGEFIWVTVSTGALSGLAVSAAVTVNAVSYRVAEIAKKGLLTHFRCTAVS